MKKRSLVLILAMLWTALAWGQPTYRGVCGASGCSALATGTTSVSVYPPSGTATNDLLLAFITDHSTTTTASTAPTGWLNIGVAGNSSGYRFQVFACTFGGTYPGASGTCSGTSWSFSGLTTRAGGAMIGFYGEELLNKAVSVSVVTANNASGTTGAGSLTPRWATSMIVAGLTAFSSASTWSSEKVATNPSASLTCPINAWANSTYLDITVCYGAQTGAVSATGALTATMGTAGQNGALLLAIDVAHDPPLTMSLTGSPAVKVAESRSASPTCAFTGSASETVCNILASTPLTLTESYTGSATAVNAGKSRSAPLTLAETGTATQNTTHVAAGTLGCAFGGSAAVASCTSTSTPLTLGESFTGSVSVNLGKSRSGSLTLATTGNASTHLGRGITASSAESLTGTATITHKGFVRSATLGEAFSGSATASTPHSYRTAALNLATTGYASASVSNSCSVESTPLTLSAAFTGSAWAGSCTNTSTPLSASLGFTGFAETCRTTQFDNLALAFTGTASALTLSRKTLTPTLGMSETGSASVLRALHESGLLTLAESGTALAHKGVHPAESSSEAMTGTATFSLHLVPRPPLLFAISGAAIAQTGKPPLHEIATAAGTESYALAASAHISQMFRPGAGTTQFALSATRQDSLPRTEGSGSAIAGIASVNVGTARPASLGTQVSLVATATVIHVGTRRRVMIIGG
jgi:hypothetical protein